MIRLRRGIVEKILWSRKNIQALLVKVDSSFAKAINYPCLTGEAKEGDETLLNTTAVWKKLGTGGFHFVVAILSIKEKDIDVKGHLMKMRYTPLQIKVNSYEESRGINSLAFLNFKGMERCPVLLAELHSMVNPLVCVIKEKIPDARLVYIMTDSASLPMALSYNIYQLKKNKLLLATITCGHAFGGDLETVNIFTALMAGFLEYSPHAMIIAPGPGIVGTGTKYGNTSLEQGENVNRINLLQGNPIFVPRVSFAEKRRRHYGISHHTLTCLTELSLTPAEVAFPVLEKEQMSYLLGQIKRANLFSKHKVYFLHVQKIIEKWKKRREAFTTMGRNIEEDPIFFEGVAAAGLRAVKLIEERGINTWRKKL
ncbi:MAG: DUF3866 family protein [Firmicutes bacterium]|nr:DUF3866 family protein [Bacillota bacterium]